MWGGDNDLYGPPAVSMITDVPMRDTVAAHVLQASRKRVSSPQEWFYLCEFFHPSLVLKFRTHVACLLVTSVSSAKFI